MTASETSSPQRDHLQEHIDLIARHEQEFLERRSRSEKLGDRMASYIGSLAYVSVHVVIFAGWIAWNTLPISGLSHFDPAPFQLLGVLFAFEAILVASFILMRQSRMSRRSEERDHLMLQILLLTEKEITAVLGVDRQMAKKMGLHKIAGDREITQFSVETSIDELAQNIKGALPTE